ncbi:hypothetical protein G7Y89_g13907 [Cudoniella acicularis]|uniref:Uncharacterized protein n=1 Tax=Cudoniella acicularis TaxID=354080 RepID=A0A8H4R8L8_9HELO|nr:hypothetical protein G7Y89_g13907 [Cudoniella acicularis]
MRQSSSGPYTRPKTLTLSRQDAKMPRRYSGPLTGIHKVHLRFNPFSSYDNSPSTIQFLPLSRSAEQTNQGSSIQMSDPDEMDSPSRANAMKAVEAIFERYKLIAKSQDFNGFDRHIMENLKLIDATEEGTVDFEFHIDERYSNLNGVMLAMIRGTMSSQDGKTIYCTCEHHKVSVPTQPAHLEHKVAWDELWVRDQEKGVGEKEKVRGVVGQVRGKL